MIIDEIHTYLSTNMPGKDINKNFFREDGDTQIVVMDIGGTSSIRSTVTEKMYRINARSSTYATAETDIQSIYNLLHNQSGVLTTPTQIIKSKEVPYFIHQDENRRFYFTSTFVVRSTGI